MNGANDNEHAINRPCERCGLGFENGSFLVYNGRVIEAACTDCLGPEQAFSEDRYV